MTAELATFGTPATTRARKPARDTVLEAAVDLALAAVQQQTDSLTDVGEHLGASTEGERLVVHRFACNLKGYLGWEWTVVLARAPRSRTATVCEVALLPGTDSLLAPTWLPWAQRLQPGDIGPGDVLPFKPDDPRLEPGYVATGDEEQDSVAIEELALARARVLSPEGINEAAQRWYRGKSGPTTPEAIHSTASCGSCGFLVPLQGPLGQLFAVCVNEWSPQDGKVVSLDHGCGAHSETDVAPHATDWPAPDPLIDELSIDIIDESESSAR